MLQVYARDLAQLGADTAAFGLFVQPGLDPHEPMKPKDREAAQRVCANLGALFDLVGLTTSRGVLDQTKPRFEDAKLTYEGCRTEFSHLQRCIAVELKPLWLLHLSPHEANYFTLSAEPFGETVAKAFPSDVNYDVLEATKCIAFARDTAAVFHLMRVAEHGLRALARKANVRVNKAPLKWAEWRELIEAIRAKKIEPIVQKRRGKQKEEELEFYRGILGEFEAFKDAYRNQVMHTRVRYGPFQASLIWVQVFTFMQRLAAKIGPSAPVA